jgi:WD40 repeat protein
MKYDCTFINSDSSEFSDIYFSHDGKYLITDGLGCNYLIDVLTGKIVQTLSEGAIGPQPFINQGKQFLTSSNRKVYINDFATREKVDSIETLNYTFRSFSFSPDGKRFVTTAYDKKLRIYDTATRKCLHSIWVPSEQQEACFSPDGRQVLSFSYKGAYVWNAETGEKLFDFPQCDIIESAKYNSDGSRILLTDEYAIYNIDAETGGVLGIIDRTKDYWVEKQDFGRWMEAIWDHSSLIALAKKDWIISVWDLATDDYIQLLNTDVNAKNIKRFIFSPNSKSIAAISGIHTIYLWGTYPNDIYCMRHKISVDGNLYRGLASFYNGGNFAVTNENGRISIWNVKTGEHIRTFGDSATVVSISSDDTYVSTGSYNGIISIWDVNTGELIRSFKGYSKAIQSILFSYDNQHLATTIDGNGFDKEKKICIWEVGSGKCIGKYDYSVDTTPLYAGQLIDISPDGKYMAIAGFFDIKLHNLKTNECVKAGLKHDALVNSVCFSPDGKYLVSASYDKSVRVWDLSSLRCIHLLVGHDKNVCTAKYSPDGKYIISASDDEIVRIWDAETGKCIERLYGHNGRVLSAAFSSDGKNVVTISNDSTIKVWDFPTLQQLIDETRERFKDRQLTPEERRKYYLE